MNSCILGTAATSAFLLTQRELPHSETPAAHRDRGAALNRDALVAAWFGLVTVARCASATLDESGTAAALGIPAQATEAARRRSRSRYVRKCESGGTQRAACGARRAERTPIGPELTRWWNAQNSSGNPEERLSCRLLRLHQVRKKHACASAPARKISRLSVDRSRGRTQSQPGHSRCHSWYPIMHIMSACKRNAPSPQIIPQ